MISVPIIPRRGAVLVSTTTISILRSVTMAFEMLLAHERLLPGPLLNLPLRLLAQISFVPLRYFATLASRICLLPALPLPHLPAPVPLSLLCLLAANLLIMGLLTVLRLAGGLLLLALTHIELPAVLIHLLVLTSPLRTLLLTALVFLRGLLLVLPSALLRLLGLLSWPALNLPGRPFLRLTSLRTIAFGAMLALTRAGPATVPLLLKLNRIASLGGTDRRKKSENQCQHSKNRCNLSVSLHVTPAPSSYRRLTVLSPLQGFHCRPEWRMNHLLICEPEQGGMPVEFGRGFPSNPALLRHAFSLEAE